MTRLLALAAIVLSGAVVAGGAQARPLACDFTSSVPISVVTMPTVNSGGFRRKLAGFGTKSLAYRARSESALIASSRPVCDPSGVILADARRAIVAEKRFYLLLRAFPYPYTKAQWKARWRPLLAAGILADTYYLRLTVDSAHSRGVPVRKEDRSGAYYSISLDLVWLRAASNYAYGRPVDAR